MAQNKTSAAKQPKRCKTCGACEECGAQPQPQVVPMPYPVYPPWQAPRPYTPYPNTAPRWIQSPNTSTPQQPYTTWNLCSGGGHYS